MKPFKSSRNIEDSKFTAKLSLSRRGSGTRRTVQYAGQDGCNAEAAQFPVFIASQTFEQRKYGASAKNSLNPMKTCESPCDHGSLIENDYNYMKSNKLCGDFCSGLDMSKRSDAAYERVFSNATPAGECCAAFVHNSQPDAPMDTGDSANIEQDEAVDLDATLTGACSLDQSLPWTEELDYKKSSSGSVSLATTESAHLIEDEGWNPLFYEPVLVLCPKNGNSERTTSAHRDRETKKTLCQQLQNWLAQGQANYIQKRNAMQLAKLEAAKNIVKLKQKQQKQQQKPQQLQRNQPNNINPNLKQEQEQQMLSTKYPFGSFNGPVAETRSTWSTKTSSWSQETPQSMQAPPYPNAEKSNRNFGAFKCPLPTPTATSFPDPYLWSVDSKNPFWIRDQRPAFANINDDDDPFGLNSLPPKPKKKESTELVDAIKAGVGLLGPSSLKMHYTNMRVPKPHEFSGRGNYGKHWPTTATGANRCPVEHKKYYGLKDYTKGSASVVSHTTSLQKGTLVSSDVNLQQATQENEQEAMRSLSADNNQSVWKVAPMRPKKGLHTHFKTALGKKSKSYTAESTSLKLPNSALEDNAGYPVLSKKSLETISVEVLMNEPSSSEPTAFKANVSIDNDSDSDEFLSGIAEDDADLGEDSFKSCLQYPYDSSEGWNDSKSASSMEEEIKHEIQSGASSSSISKRFVAPSELELKYATNDARPLAINEQTCNLNANQTLQDSARKTNPPPPAPPVPPVKDVVHKETQTTGPVVYDKKKRTERFYSQVKVRSIGNSIFDLEATRLILEHFNLYIEANGPSAMERLSGFEYTVETIQKLLKYRGNNRPCLRGVFSMSPKVKFVEVRSKKNPNDNGDGVGAERKFRYQKAQNPHGKPSIRAHSQIPGRYAVANNDDDDGAAHGSIRNNAPRFNPHWKSSKVRVIRQQQQQQRSQYQQLQQQPQQQQPIQQEQQGFSEFPYQRTTVFTNSFHRNYHTKRVCRKPPPPPPNSFKNTIQHEQQQQKASTDSMLFESPFDLVPPSEPVNLPQPMPFENNNNLTAIQSYKDKHGTLTEASVMDIEQNTQMPAKEPNNS